MWLIITLVYLALGTLALLSIFAYERVHRRPISLLDHLVYLAMTLVWPCILISFLIERSSDIILWRPKPPPQEKPPCDPATSPPPAQP